MTRRADTLARLPCAPAAFRLAEAAAYVGVSVSEFLTARKEGIAPRPRLLRNTKVYRRVDLDEMLALLPREGGDDTPPEDGLDPWGEDDPI